MIGSQQWGGSIPSPPAEGGEGQGEEGREQNKLETLSLTLPFLRRVARFPEARHAR